MEPNTTKTKRHPRRSDDEWVQLITDCRTSGLSDIAWCRENKIGTSTFYYHIRRLTQKACQLPENPKSVTRESHEIVPLRVEDDSLADLLPAKEYISPVSPMSPMNETDIAVRMSFQNISLEFTNKAEKSTILNVIAALQLLC